MSVTNRHPLIRGASVTSLGTLASRVLGMLRDMGTAALFGLSGGGVMDAFILAFRIPNLFRRLFGEGALAASYLPVLAAELERDRRAAWRLVSVGLVWLAIALGLLVVVLEIGLAGLWLAWGDVPRTRLVLELTAVMMPYVIFICLAAQVSATLHTLGRFGVAALSPAVLNIVWLVAVWGIAPYFAPNQEAQAHVLAVAVTIGGVLQLITQVPDLHLAGFRFDYSWADARGPLAQILRAMGPMVLGLTITQINTLLDSLIAWALSSGPAGPERIAWLPGEPYYPMRQGAVAAIYFGERLYQFPLGLLGLAVATAIFPLLSRHAARGDRRRLGEDLTLGCRLVLFLGLPASAGLVLLAGPITQLLFERGEFTAQDSLRAARMIAVYGAGVWAYCALHVVVRGYYALGDRITPMKIGAVIVVLNFALNLLLVWPFAEAGLALATALTAGLQVFLLMAMFSRRKSHLDWRALAATAVRTLLATTLMTLAGYAALRSVPDSGGLTGEFVRVLLPLGTSTLAYFAAIALFGRSELQMLHGALPVD